MTISRSNFTGYVVFTRNAMDHQLVHVIGDHSHYDRARQLAKTVGGSIMFADQFNARFHYTTPNRYNGILS